MRYATLGDRREWLATLYRGALRYFLSSFS